MISSFYQYHSGCVFYCNRIARKAEAGRDTTPACFELFVTILKLLLVGLSLGGADIIFILSDGNDSGLDTAGNVL